MTMFTAERLKFVYSIVGEDNSKDFLTAIDNIDFKIEKGEFVAILGHNGSGKSTLAKLLNALFLPSSGVLYVNGIETTETDLVWEIRRNVGMVFQNPDNQIVATVVEEDVAFGLENLGVPGEEIRKRVDDALKAVDMFDYSKHSPYMLSGGQKQRVSIAGIIAMKPACIVLDEPTAMLDPKGRKEVNDTIRMLNKEGITVILITHFVEETIDCDRVIIMDNGKIRMNGSPEKIVTDSEKMRKYGLEIPVATEIAELLRKGGVDVPSNILNIDELVDEICKLKLKT